jgi:hypothetical protein
MLETFTFDSIIQNGIIPIPEEYRDIADGEVKITVQKEEHILSKNRKTYNAIELDTRNFIFSRDESNAR